MSWNDLTLHHGLPLFYFPTELEFHYEQAGLPVLLALFPQVNRTTGGKGTECLMCNLRMAKGKMSLAHQTLRISICEGEHCLAGAGGGAEGTGRESHAEARLV